MSAISHFPVVRNELENGLTVLVKEQHASPVVAVLAHVNIGYLNEPDRWNGLSHVIEHMFFKGTTKRPGKEQIAEEVRALGGMINAGTYYDQTSYYLVAPAENVEPCLEILADMFLNGLFDEDELAKELEVIIQESKQKRDSPTYLLLQSMYARAFDRHWLRRWRIGDDVTLRAFRRKDLVEFIEATYRPENIVLTVVGDIDAQLVRDAAHRHWASLPRGRFSRETSPEEPVRMGLRYDRMRGAIAQRLVEVGFPAPDLLHPDSAPLSVAGALLSDGRSSRLFRSLKEEKRVANSVWAGYEGFTDTGVFTLGGESIADDPVDLEKGLFDEVRKLSVGPISQEELKRIKTRLESRRLFAEEEVLGVARTLAYYEAALGDYREADETLARLKAVTAEEVQRVAAHYLTVDQATILEYLPNEAVAPERSPEEMKKALSPASEGPKTERKRDKVEEGQIQEATLLGRSQLLLRRRSDLPIVSLFVLFPGGKRAETAANSGITSLMLKSSLKGTETMSAEEIANRIEGLGAGIGMTNAPDYFGYSLKIIRSRVNEGIAILREVLRAPRFAPDEVEREKQSIYGEIRRQQDSMSGRAVDLCNQAMFGSSPYGLPAAGIVSAVEPLTSDQLRVWHSHFVRPESAVIGAVCDLGVGELTEMLEGAFAAGPGEPADRPKIELTEPGELSVQIDRQQTAAVMAFPGVTTCDDDRFALDLLAEITSGQAGRFFQAVRGDNALAYAVSSLHRARRDAGSFVTYTATSPKNEELARSIILEECERLKREAVGEKELEDAKEAIVGEHAIGMQTFGAQAGELAINRLLGKPVNSSEIYLERIRALTAEEVQQAAKNYLDAARTWRGIVKGSAA